MEVQFAVPTPRGTIRGTAHLPSAHHCACLILCHGLTGHAHERTLVTIARHLEKNQVACIRYDCIGSGQSDGESAQACVLTEVEDTLAVLEYALHIPQIDASRIVLGGHSLGALVALMAAQRCTASGLALLSPALSCYHELIALLTGAQLRTFRETGLLDLGGFQISKTMVDELTDIDGYRIACELRLPTLLVHGELDGDSPVYHSIRLKEKLGALAQLHIVPGVHHCYETAQAQAEVACSVAEFMQTIQ